MEKISVVIPVYNSEPYIEQCIRSVTAQTYPYLEILIVDDGSIDQSREICERLACRDDRIRNLSQTHQGASSARNHGLDVLQGEYVFFLDSDDAIHPRLLEELLRQMKRSHAELGFCLQKRMDDDRMEQLRWDAIECEQELEWNAMSGQTAEEWFFSEKGDELWGIGGKLIHIPFFGSLRFEKDIALGEDTLFLYRLLRKRPQTIRLCMDWYCYRIHSGSTTYLLSSAGCVDYLRCGRLIRDQEAQEGHDEFALRWEKFILWEVRRKLINARNRKDPTGYAAFRAEAVKEQKNPLLHRIPLRSRCAFSCFVLCYPLYSLLKKVEDLLLKKINLSRKNT